MLLQLVESIRRPARAAITRCCIEMVAMATEVGAETQPHCIQGIGSNPFSNDNYLHHKHIALTNNVYTPEDFCLSKSTPSRRGRVRVKTGLTDQKSKFNILQKGLRGKVETGKEV